ncbi:MAG: DUF192 domain-containing protein [Bdellovibrio sp.]|nr:DUF192 domain-containing protein [Bdellovibrio sp.]
METNLRKIKVILVKNKAQIADECSVAESFWSRFMGLMGVRILNPGSGLLLSPCSSIHMLFMNIPIDVVFLSERVIRDGAVFYRISSLKENLRPWGLLPVGDWKAVDTLELPIGTIQKCDMKIGDEVCLS